MTDDPVSGPQRLLRLGAPFLAGGAPDLSDLGGLLLERIPDIVARFYVPMRASEAAWAHIGSTERFERLHASLSKWLQAFLTCPPEARERADLALRMSDRHVQLGIPLDLTLFAHVHLRRLVTGEVVALWPGEDRGGLADALSRLHAAFDLDAVILVSMSHGLSLRREAATRSRMQQMNDRLEEGLRSQELLLRTTSHELRTPLTGLLGMLNLLRRGIYRDPEELAQVHEDVHQAARHLLVLVDDLLHLARLESAKGDWACAEFDACEAAREVARRFQLRFEEAGVALEVAGPPCRVRADRDRHAQVLSNLLQNALNHTAAGRVSVEVAPLEHGGHVLTRVADTGAGIPGEVLESLFKPFVQGAAAQHGLGLGLAICRRLVLRMGGRIRGASDGPGCGAAFEFTLPAARGHSDPARSFGPAAARDRILVVDDDPVWIEDLAGLLAGTVPAALDGVAGTAAARAALDAEVYRLILMDVALPAGPGEAGDGIDFLESLAFHPQATLVPKWLVSGHSEAFLADDLARGWHDAFWSKAAILRDSRSFAEAVRRTVLGREGARAARDPA